MNELTPDEHRLLVNVIQDSATVVHKGRKDMNERIRQLLSQAGVHYEVLPKDSVYEKFAELIVKDCLDIVNRHEYSYHEADPLWETAQLIKERFGVDL
jgi:hypothetical protein